MARLRYPTTMELDGPILVDAIQLQALDALLDRHTESLSREKARRILDLTEEKCQRGLRAGFTKEQVDDRRSGYQKEAEGELSLRDSRAITVYLSRGRELEGQTVSEVIAQPAGQEEIPLGLSLHLRVGEIIARVRLSRRWTGSGMHIEVEPDDNEVQWNSLVPYKIGHPIWLRQSGSRSGYRQNGYAIHC